MRRNITWRLILIGVLTVISIFIVTPSFVNNLPGWWKNLFPSTKLNLGLDLKGGTYLVFGVDINKAIKDDLTRKTRELQAEFTQQKIAVQSISVTTTGNINLALSSPSDRDKLYTILKDDFQDLRITEEQPPSFVLSLTASEINYMKNNILTQAVENIRNRVDQFGVTEPIIHPQGTNQIVVELPGIKNPQRAIDIIGKTAQLEFILVDEQPAFLADIIKNTKPLPDGIYAGSNTVSLPDGETVQSPYLWAYSKGQLESFLQGKVPDKYMIGYSVIKDKNTNSTTYQTDVLEKNVNLTGDMLSDARMQIGGEYNQPYVSIRFNARGAKLFDQLTGAHVGERLAIVLDNIVYSAPVIRERISGGNAQISGNFTENEAKDLAIVLRAGALPAPVKVLMKNVVGPTLGSDSIKEGMTAAIIGGIMVIAFMLVYYTIAGIIADIGLVLNVMMLLAILAMFGATLTLPGIAGIILSIGMAVDTNVLNFERTREELKIGKPVKTAVDAGYDKAFYTIIDSHITTLITAIVLYIFGTGPIKGFAVTLSIGVTLNLFTGLFATRAMFDYLNSKVRLTRLKFFEIIKNTKINFMGARRYTYIISGILVAVGIIGSIQIARGKANIGIDFGGGTSVQVIFEKPIKISDVRTALEHDNIPSPEIQELPKLNEFLISIKKTTQVKTDVSDQVINALKSAFNSNNFTVEGITEIGPVVGKNMQRNALWAIIFSLIAIVIYIAWRFEFKFGVAATIATAHDVLVVIGVFYILDKEITLLFVTALLTLAGYSLTDTVVVFDRIRERLRTRKNETNLEVFNRSVNEVLSRTIITSLTVFIVVFAMYILGGSVLHDFALAMLIGVVVGTYSSVFIASAVVIDWVGEKGKVFQRKR
ncbi:MAG: protein translocase subunit SecD [Deltaproteobacteria bacterium]|nr:protein translocase subunit SecD [Deltaproteobacteria bacterium]MCL5791834.1 protein translocase subunit SecD [Deltaproteobacteria bacterium]